MDRRKAIKQLVEGFASQIDSVLDQIVALEVQSTLTKISKGVGRVPIRGKRQPKPCPVPDCKLDGAPRYGMFCVSHDKHYSHEEKVVLRDRAKRPGGKWFKIKKKAEKKAASAG